MQRVLESVTQGRTVRSSLVAILFTLGRSSCWCKLYILYPTLSPLSSLVFRGQVLLENPLGSADLGVRSTHGVRFRHAEPAETQFYRQRQER